MPTTCRYCGTPNLNFRSTRNFRGWALFDGKGNEHDCPKKPQPKPVACKFCAASHLFWKRLPGGHWMLLESDGTRHHCEAYRNMTNDNQTNKLSCPVHKSRWVYANRCVMCEIIGGDHAILQENPPPKTDERVDIVVPGPAPSHTTNGGDIIDTSMGV